jgi:plasmid stability protein
MSNIQYTIRGIAQRVDARIRERAAREGKSLNETVLELLKAGLGIANSGERYTDLDDLAGTWVDDPEFDRAIREMDRVDPELWK